MATKDEMSPSTLSLEESLPTSLEREKTSDCVKDFTCADDDDVVIDDVLDGGNCSSLDPDENPVERELTRRYTPTPNYYHESRVDVRLDTLSPTMDELNRWDEAKNEHEFFYFVSEHSGRNHDGLLKEYCLTIRNRENNTKRTEVDNLSNEYAVAIESYVDADWACVDAENDLFGQMMKVLCLTDPRCIYDPANSPGNASGDNDDVLVVDKFKFRAVLSFQFIGTEEEYEEIFAKRNFPELNSTTNE